MNASRAVVSSCLFFVLSMALPPIALAIGWIGWTWDVGLIAALLTLAVCGLFSTGSLLLVRDPSWALAFVPFAMGCFYSILPDFIPIPIDDAAAVAAGALVTLIIAIKKAGAISFGAVVSMSAAAAYTLVGDVIPGPVDELVVYMVTGTIASQSMKRLAD